MSPAQPPRHSCDDAEFERLYQQAYYRHSGFGAGSQEPVAPARPHVATEITFTALALVFFVVPALTAALVV